MVSLSASEKLFLFDLKFLEAFPNVLSNFAESASLDDILTNNLQSLLNMHDGRKLPKFEAKLTDIFLNKHLNNLDLDGQQNIFHTLGRILNKPLYQTCLKFREANKWDLKTIIDASKRNFYFDSDKRLVAFIDGATQKDNEEEFEDTDEKINYKVNAIENLMKDRRKDTITPTGVREHIAVYFSSDRNVSVSEIFSKMGTKGSRTTVECIMKNSLETSKFKIPEKSTVFMSFDNVQKLYKIYRLHENTQSKAIGIVVTSVVSILPDGLVRSDVQYVLRHNPTLWLHKYEVNLKSLFIVEKLDASALTKITEITDEDLKLVLGRFEYDLSEAMKSVESEMSKEGLDSIDKIVKQTENANSRTCLQGHLNENIRGNRKYCVFCKETFKEIEEGNEDLFEVVFKEQNGVKKVEIKEAKDKYLIYPNVRNLFPEHDPIIKSNGVVFVNPNRPSRVAKVLKYLQQESGTYRKFVSSLCISENNEIFAKS